MTPTTPPTDNLPYLYVNGEYRRLALGIYDAWTSAARYVRANPEDYVIIYSDTVNVRIELNTD